jgi:hypothetical protein
MPRRTFGGKVRSEFLLCAGALLGVALLAYPTAPWGAGVGQGALHCFHAAEGLRAGEGMQLSRGGEPFTHWPPLLPVLLALGRSLGLSYAGTGLLINLLATFATLYLGAKLVLRWLGPAWLAWIWLALMLISPDQLGAAALVGSDPLFGALLLACLHALLVYLERPGRSLWVAAGLVLLSCLLRYIGVALVAAGSAVLLGFPRELPWRVRARRALGFAVLALLPLLAWLLRNRLLGHALNEDWAEAELGVLDNTRAVWSALRELAGPDSLGVLPSGLLTGLVALSTGSLLAARWLRGREPALLATVAFTGIYLASLIGITSLLHTDPIGVRFVLPVQGLLTALALLGAREAWTVLAQRPPWQRCAACAPFVLLIGMHAIHSQSRTRAWIVEVRAEGLVGLSTRAWVASELLTWLRANPLQGEIHSNVPELFLQTQGRRAHLLAESGPSGLPAGAWLVWVDLPQGAPRSDRPAFCAGGARLRVVADLSNGCVLRVEPGP